jgi:uncharacterized RDD family membrane protein YckC
MATQPTTTAPQCCLCGNWLQFGAKPLYGYQVCPKCYSDFAWKRAFAYIIDIVIVNAIVGVMIVVALIVGAVIIGAAQSTNSDQAATAGAVIFIFGYLGSFLMAYVLITLRDGWGGESPGKRIIGLRVIHSVGGASAGWGDSVKRNIILVVPVIPIVVIVQIFSGNGLRLGDEWARTKVIWKKYADRAPFLSLAAAEAQARRARAAMAKTAPPVPVPNA